MDSNTDLVDLAVAACVADLGSADGWVAPDFLRDSLALNVIESIQAPRSHYTSVRNVLDRYRTFRAEADGDAAADGTHALLATFEELGGADAWANLIGNRKPVTTRLGSPRKAAVIRDAAALLADMGADTAGDLREFDVDAFRRLRIRWTALPGQSTGLSWRYLMIHANLVPVGDDPAVTAYFGGAGAAELLNATAERLGVPPERLAYAIWRYQNGRPVAEVRPVPSG